jgi:hypothetical protein
MLPPELRALLDQIDACETDAEQIVSGLDEDSVNWVPAPAPGASRWSVAQCLHHLTLMNDVYLREWPGALRQTASRELGPFSGLRPTFIGRWFVNSLEPPVKFKMKAPAPSDPGGRQPLAGLIERYKVSHETYRHLVRGSAAVDVNRVTAQNPFIKRVRMRLATVLLIIPAHDRRHLWQAASVKRALAGR